MDGDPYIGAKHITLEYGTRSTNISIAGVGPGYEKSYGSPEILKATWSIMGMIWVVRCFLI